MSDTKRQHHDVLIVGAGLSGIGAAYHLQTQCPKKSYAILETRENLGGTWDLFRYPGVRSDSDMHTLGFSFRPWTEAKAIADGGSILAYVRDTAEAYGMDKKIQFGRRVIAAAWSSDDARWTLSVRHAESGTVETHTCGFLFVCAGYYDYENGYTPEFAGREKFLGRIVHPQFWTPDIDYSGKRVVVIGSGATAITLLPELAKTARHVTMLQRSPSYVMAVPARDTVANWLRLHLSPERAYSVTRWKNVLLFMAFYEWCRLFPERATGFLIGRMKHGLGDSTDVHTHFSPTYRPWEQRLCFAPDGDFFTAIRDGRADVVTEPIESFTENGLRLRSGRELEADLIVTATGLKLQLFGGMAVTVDGHSALPSDTLIYKGMMCSDIPNLAFAVGYTNASWTLKVDLVAGYVCRLLNHMDAHGHRRCTPRRATEDVATGPLIDFNSGYVKRALDSLPKQGNRAPWKLRQNYVLDLVSLKHAPLTDKAMEFTS